MTKRVARKEHDCMGCTAAIVKGQPYVETMYGPKGELVARYHNLCWKEADNA